MQGRAWGRRVAWGALVGVGVLLTLVAGLFVFLHTKPGSNAVRRIVQPRLDRAFNERLAYEASYLRGRTLVLRGLALRDDRGEDIVRVPEARVTVSIRALVNGDLDVARAVLRHPHVHLVRTQDGLNLTRALQTQPQQQEKASTPSEPGSGPAIRVRDLLVDGATVSYRDRTTATPPLVLRPLNLRGEASYQPSGEYRARLNADGLGRIGDAAERKLALAATAEGERERLAAQLDLAFGGDRVKARASQRGEVLAADIDEVTVTPGLVALLAPQVPLAGRVQLRGRVEQRAGALEAQLRALAGGGTIEISARARPEAKQVASAQVTVTGLNLRRLITDAPATDLNLTLTAARVDLARLAGDVKVRAPRLVVGDITVRDAELQAQNDPGRTQPLQVNARAPGLSLRARGRAEPRRLDLTGELDVRDLGAALRPVRGRGRHSGRGRMTFAVQGAPSALAVRAQANFPRVIVDRYQAHGLRLQLNLPDSRSPLQTDLSLQADEVRAGGPPLRQLRVALASHAARGFRLRASAGAPLFTNVAADGAWGEQGRTLRLAQLMLAYPGVTWRTNAPTQITVAGPLLVIDGLDLRAGKQRLALDLRRDPRRLSAHLRASAFDLSRLPELVVRDLGRVAGTLDADVRVDGAAARPRVRGRLSLEEGRFRNVNGLSLKAEGQYLPDRAAGTVDARLWGASLEARFDAPTRWPAPRSAPVDLQVDARDVDLTRIARALNLTAPARGRFTLSARAEGRAGDPRVTMNLAGRGVAVDEQPLGDVQANVTANGQRLALDATLGLGQASHARARVDVGLGTLLRAARPLPLLLNAPAEADISVQRLPLTALARLAGAGQGYDGAVSLKLKAQGPARSPAGDLTLQLHDARGPGIPATSALLTAAYMPVNGRGDLNLKVTRAARTLASAEAHLRLPPGQRPNLTTLGRAPLQVRAAVGPLEVQKLVLDDSARTRLNRLRGQLAVQLQLDGTLDDPRAAVQAQVERLQLGNAALGAAKMQARYQKRSAQAQVTLTSANRGRLQLDATTALDLSLPGLRRGIKPAQTALNARMVAQGFDLALLSGLSDQIPTVGGQLDADAQVRGTLADPRPSGQLTWRDGRLAVLGYGRYREIQLKVRGDHQRLVLEQLSVVSGRGNARLTGTAQARGDRPGYEVQAQARLREFPVYSDGQAIARLTLNAGARGQASTQEVQLSTKIDEARVQMIEGADKDVQSMARPPDVIILENGQPIDRDEARRWARLMATRAPATQVPGQPREGVDQPFAVRMQIDAPRNVWITGSDVSLELGLEPGFTVNITDEARVYGTVLVRRGHVTVIGRRFDLQPSSAVHFSGLTDRPQLDVNATHHARKANMTVQLSLDGTPDDLKIGVSSPENPQLTESDLLTVVVTGRRPDEKSNSAVTPSAKAASLVGSVLANKLQRVLSRRLPVDVLNIEPGEGVTGPRLEAGAYLTDDLYFAYVARLGLDPFSRLNRNEVHLEYQLSRRWSFAATYGDARRGSGDLVWTKHF